MKVPKEAYPFVPDKVTDLYLCVYYFEKFTWDTISYIEYKLIYYSLVIQFILQTFSRIWTIMMCTDDIAHTWHY